jgi:hypothetical protein
MMLCAFPPILFVKIAVYACSWDDGAGDILKNKLLAFSCWLLAQKKVSRKGAKKGKRKKD